MRIKICGLTRLEDALLAHSLGATELGFIFCESPRQISLYEAKNILFSLPKKARAVGVFKDTPIEDIIMTVESLALTTVQLHGSESQEFVRELKNKKPELTIIKAILEKEGEFLQDPTDYDQCDYLLFDSAEKKPITVEIKTTKPFFLAGALRKENVLSMISTYGPMGVDLASGVESSAGIKNELLMREFFLTMKGML